MVYKVVSGVLGNLTDLWINEGVANETQEDALNTSSVFKGHYKNRIVDIWRVYRPKEVNKNLVTMHLINRIMILVILFLLCNV